MIVNQPARAAFRSISTRFSVNDWRRLLAARSSVYFFSFRLGKIIRRHEVTYRPYFGSRPSSSWNQGQYSTKVVLCERNYLSSWMTRLHCANYSETVRSLVEKFAMPIVHRLVHSFRVSPNRVLRTRFASAICAKLRKPIYRLLLFVSSRDILPSLFPKLPADCASCVRRLFTLAGFRSRRMQT